MSENDEARGLHARIAVLDREVEEATAQLMAEHRNHWVAAYEDQLFDALRRRDVLTERLEAMTQESWKVK
jgi:hypothetical protein